jgi:hypothetical protein
MEGSNVGVSKWITARKVIELLSRSRAEQFDCRERSSQCFSVGIRRYAGQLHRCH